MSTLQVATIQTNTPAGVLAVRDSNDALTGIQPSEVRGIAANTPPVFQDSAGTQIGTLARAWVNFNGTGTVAIRAAFNVSSITDNGAGNYTANFTASMTDTNYIVTAIANGQNSFEDINAVRTGTRTTSAIQLGVVNGNATVFVDSTAVQVAIFR